MLAFEKPDFTLDTFSSDNQILTRYSLWQVAKALNNFHRAGAIHGSLNSTNIARFGGKNWKLLNIGSNFSALSCPKGGKVS